MIGMHYDEMRDEKGALREHYRAFAEWLEATPPRRISEKRREADLQFHRVGITFAVYGDQAGAERLIPFDTIPRIIPKAEWNALAGLDPAADLDPESPRLRDLLIEWQAAAEQLSELIGQRFFSHVAEDRHQSVSA